MFLFLTLEAKTDQWQLTESIWNFGIISSCDKGIGSPLQYFSGEPYFDKAAYSNLQRGDVVWCKCRFLPQFYHQIVPQLTDPIILVVSDGDESFPYESGLRRDEVEELINHEMIFHIFAQNCDYPTGSDKVTYLPIGMDFHSIAYKGAGWWGEKGSPLEQEEVLHQMLTTFAPTSLRKPRAFVDFQHKDTMHEYLQRHKQFGEDRTTIFNRLKKTGLIDHAGSLKRSELWRRKGEYAFSISPPGNGLDCHRTWEDLILGCIVIVKTCSLDPMYAGLPVVIIQDWDEITEANLQLWQDQYGDAFTNPSYREKLSYTYWRNQILFYKNQLVKPLTLE